MDDGSLQPQDPSQLPPDPSQVAQVPPLDMPVMPNVQLPVDQPPDAEPPPPSPMQLPTTVSKDKPLYLVNPEDGKTYEVSDKQNAGQALSWGWRPENKDEFTNRITKAVIAEHPIAGTIAAVTGQFTNQALFGIPELIRENTGSEDEKAQAKATDRAITGEHPVLNIAGGVAGTAATLLGTGVGKALGYLGEAAAGSVQSAAALGGEKLAQSVVTKLASAGAKYGVENAAFMVPYRVTEEVLGDPNIASEGIFAAGAKDFLLGGALGGGASLLGSAIKGTAQFAEKSGVPEWLQGKANEFQFKNTGALTTELNRLGQVTGKTYRGEQLQDIVNTLDKYTDSWDQLKGPQAIYDKMLEVKGDLGDKLTSTRRIADSLTGGSSISYNQIDDGIQRLRAEYSKGNLDTPGMQVTSPKAQPELDIIDTIDRQWKSVATEKLRAQGLGDQEIAQAFQRGWGLPSFGLEEMHQFRKDIRDLVYKSEEANNVISSAGNDFWNGTSKIMDDTINKIGEVYHEPILKDAFSTTNKNYATVKNVTDQILRSASARAMARNKIGLGSLVAGAAGAAAEGGPGGVLAMATGLVKQHYGNYLAYQTLGTAAKVLEGVQGDITKSIGEAISGDVGKAAILGSVGVWSRYTGEDKTEPKEAFKTFQNDIAKAQSAPDGMSQVMNSLTPGMANYAPQNYALMGATAQRAMQYLQDSSPKPPPAIFPGGPVPSWTPSDNDLSKYSRRVDAIFNPLSILDELKHQTLTAEAVDAVKTVYPNLYGAIQTQIQKSLASAPANQVQKIKNKLSLLMDGMEDPQARATKIQTLQGGFAPNNNHAKPNANSKIDEAGRATTEINRVLNQ